MADDKLRPARVASISPIMVAMAHPRFAAIVFNASINSGSSDMLVRWPDKETDIFFILHLARN